ncbi:hypothetical protein KEM52_004499, partial [Ascosphaera acerosa]
SGDLWVSKLALLFASRVLILHLPQYNALFWTVVAVQGVSFVVYVVLLYAPDNITLLWTIFDYPLIQERHPSVRTVYIVQYVLDIFTDLLSMILPCRLLPGLRLAPWKRAMALVVFTIGLVIVVFASLRIGFLLRAFHVQFPAIQGSVQALTWSQLHAAMSAVIANAPALRNVIQHHVVKQRERRRRRGRKAAAGTRQCKQAWARSHGSSAAAQRSRRAGVVGSRTGTPALARRRARGGAAVARAEGGGGKSACC